MQFWNTNHSRWSDTGFSGEEFGNYGNINLLLTYNGENVIDCVGHMVLLT